MAYPFQNRFTSSTEGEFGPLIPLDNLDMFAESNSQSEDSAWVHNNPLNRLSETLNHYPIPLFSPSKFPLDHENVQPSNFHDTVDASSSLFAYSSEGDSHVYVNQLNKFHPHPADFHKDATKRGWRIIYCSHSTEWLT